MYFTETYAEFRVASNAKAGNAVKRSFPILISRSSCPEVFSKKCVPKNFVKLTEKYLC